MANTSLSSARRGRARVSRDYTAKLRTDAYVREAGRTAKMSTIGMIGSFAAGAAELAAVAKTNVKGWERLQEGGEALHKEGKHKGDFDLATSLGRGDKPISTWEKWTTQAPVTEQLSIGDDQFYGINVAQVGALGQSAGLLVDKDSDKNLYDFLKIGGDKSTKPEQIASVVQKSVAQNNTGNTVSGQPFRYRPSSSPNIITTTQQGHSGTGGASRVDLDTYGTVQHQTGSQSVTAFETSAPTFINPNVSAPTQQNFSDMFSPSTTLQSDNLYDNYGVTNWFDSQEGGSDSSSLYDDIYGGGDFGVVPLSSVDVSRGMRNYRLK